MKYYLIVVIAALIVLSGCGKWFKGNQPDEKLVRAYKEVLIIKELNNDSLKEMEMIKKVLSESGYTQNSFDKEISDLSKDQAKFGMFLDSVQQNLKREMLSIQRSKNKSSEER